MQGGAIDLRREGPVMLIAAVVMATVLGLAPDDDPAGLVARLGSPRFADREAAAESLRRLGDQALRALRKARSDRDPEIRIRASKLRDEIEAGTLLKATIVRLDFHDRPLSDVVEEIGRRAGVSLISGDQPSLRRRPQTQSSWPDRRITLEATDPVLFWEAIDRLGQSGKLHRLYPQHPYGLDEPFDRLILAPGAASPPKSDSGPFRVELLRICRERDLDLTPGRSQIVPRPVVAGPPPKLPVAHFGPKVQDVRTASFFAELLISVEPRLRIVGEASVEPFKVSDAQGHSLLREPTAEERKAEIELLRMNPHMDPHLHPEVRYGLGSRRSSPAQLRWIPLADSTPPGVRLAELKGVIAVAVMGRRSEPLVIPLAGAKEKTIENDGARLTVHEAVINPNQFYGELELSLETEKPAETLKIQGPGIGPLEVSRPLDLIERELEIADDHNQPMDWSFLRTPTHGLRGRMRLQVRPRNQGERLDFSNLRLRFSPMVGAAIEVPFSFTDVPMP
jgi:hypothetical protein